MKMNLNLSLKKKTIFFFRILFFCILFYTGSDVANAAPIKILSDTLHAADGIISTINQLMGVGHVGTDIIVHSNSQENDGYGFTADPADALSTTTPRYDTTGTLVTSVAPYQLLTTSATGYSGDNFDQFNLYSSNDLAHNYAFSVDLGSKTLPPVFHFAPGLPSYGSGSGYGAEWTLDPAIFSTADLSYLNAVNAGMMAVVRFNHPAWNWLDVKAALRQTGTNWPTGFDKNTYGFGVVDYASATGFSDNQILLQPPATNVANAGISSQVTFTLYPFKQTRRVKEVLFQFASAPAFHGSEMTLSEITTLGGTKITEYSGTLAVQSAPIFTALTNAYFVWFTSDNAVDNSAHFSRIDTYSVLGPISQSEISFTSIFDFGSLAPANNTIFSSQIPTLNWADAVSRLGIAKYQLFIDGSLNKDNITGTSTTPTASLLSGKHISYLKAFDNNGNSTTTPSVRTFYVIPGYAAGHTFYVDNLLGSDNNEGSQSQPFATIALAGTLAQAGDTVVIIKNADTPHRDTIANTNAGTQGSHVTFRGIDANHKPEIWGSNSVSNSWSVYSGDTYMRTMTIGSNKVNLVAVGNSTSTISIKTKGSSRTTLNQGEWFWLDRKSVV